LAVLSKVRYLRKLSGRRAVKYSVYVDCALSSGCIGSDENSAFNDLNDRDELRGYPLTPHGYV
jgi:hypothetical protein